VLPREFALGVADATGTAREPAVTYTAPVGTHPRMTDAIAERARRFLGDDADETDAALAVVGHGTDRNPNSAEAIYDHVAALRDRYDFAEVGALFMDEVPYVESVLDAFDADEIAVVPLFVADGFHTQDEIPELLGITDDPRSGYPVPGEVRGRRIWYASAVGTDPFVPEVILERAGDAGADLDRSTTDAPVRPDAGDAFLSWVEATGRREWGELHVAADGEGYALSHRADRDTASAALDTPDSVAALRDRIRTADDGHYRPFSGERSLPTGWGFDGLGRVELLRAVATVYPASVETWADDPDPVPYRETATRQSGIYERTVALSRADLAATTEAVCGDCAKRRDWDERREDSLPVDRGDGHLPCREPCSFLVAAAREMLDEPPDEQPPDRPDDGVPPGDLTDPANRYRVRYRRACETPPTR
jgi:sirohydrochlorin cobaltochelatase